MSANRVVFYRRAAGGVSPFSLVLLARASNVLVLADRGVGRGGGGDGGGVITDVWGAT